MQSMKGATMLLGSMNRQMNLPALQRIAMEFERENEVMDERQEMMDDAIDEATGIEGEEEEGEDIVKEVLDEIGVDLGQSVRFSTRNRKCVSYADRPYSWVKHLRTYNKQRPSAKLLLRKPLAAVAVAVAEAAVMPAMMTSKQGWTAFDDDNLSFLCFRILRCSLRGSAAGLLFLASASFFIVAFHSKVLACTAVGALLPTIYLRDIDVAKHRVEGPVFN